MAIIGVLVVFWQSFHNLFVVFVICFFENHEKTRKKQFRKLRKGYQKNYQLPENHEKNKKQDLPKEYKLSAFDPTFLSHLLILTEINFCL